MVCKALLLGLTLVASVTDVLRHKIYNWTTYSGILAGLALGAADSTSAPVNAQAAARLEYWLGAPPFLDSLWGLLICGGLLIVSCLLFPDIGFGDAKLMAMVGTFLGAEKGLEAVLWSFVLCACLGLILLIWRVGPFTSLSLVTRLLLSKLSLPGVMPLSEEDRLLLKPQIFLSPSAFVAVVIVRFELIT